MKILVELKKDKPDAYPYKYHLQDTVLNQNFDLKTFNSVTKMPNEYFTNKYRPPKRHIWVVYGKETCPFCKSTNRLLNRITKTHVDEFIFIDIEKVCRYNKTTVLNELGDVLNGHTTVPMVFHNNKFIGGNSELHEYVKTLKNL